MTCLCRFALSNICNDTGKNTELSKDCSVIWTGHTLLPCGSSEERVFCIDQKTLVLKSPTVEKRLAASAFKESSLVAWSSLKDAFSPSVGKASDSIILNDDCKDPSNPFLNSSLSKGQCFATA